MELRIDAGSLASHRHMSNAKLRSYVCIQILSRALDSVRLGMRSHQNLVNVCGTGGSSSPKLCIDNAPLITHVL